MEVSVSHLRGEVNRLESIIWAIENQITNENAVIFYKEVCDLLDGVDIIPSDYYADTRKYSKIPGVKNIRMSYNNTIIVKLLSQKGHLLPDKINIRGEEYAIEFAYSKHYDECLDY